LTLLHLYPAPPGGERDIAMFSLACATIQAGRTAFVVFA
jgi:hypothetical protein